MRALVLAAVVAAAVPSPVLVPWTQIGAKAHHAFTRQAPDHAGRPRAIALTTDGPQPETAFGAAYEVLDARPWRGKRVRVRALANATNVGVWAGLFIRSAAQGDPAGGLAGVRSTPVARAGWSAYALVTDVAANAIALVFGLALRGGGRVAVEAPLVEGVGPEVPLTPLVVSDDGPQDTDFEGPATGTPE